MEKASLGGGGGGAAARRQSFTSVRLGSTMRLLKPGMEYGQQYEVGEVLGNDDLVVSVTKIENEVEYACRSVARKEMPLQDNHVLQDHLAVLSTLEHLHICHFLEAFDNGERMQLIYEKASPLSIFEEDEALRSGKPVAQEIAQLFCRQIASALRVAHKNGVVHGRLCDTSLLRSLAANPDEEKVVKICDFGQTFLLRPHRTKAKIDWSAPELVWEELATPSSMTTFRANIKAFESTDMWSLGVILYRMITGRMPFVGKDRSTLQDSIKSSTVAFGPEWNGMPDAREVVHGLLMSSWRIRVTADRVLKHPWIVLSKARMRRSKMMRVLQNVMFNTAQSTFKKFALRVIAEEMPPEKLEIVQNAFSILDKNGDGTLEVEEIRSALKKYGEEEAAADEIFEAIDRDASGTLNFAEFTAVSLGTAEYMDREVLFNAFSRFDRNGDGAFNREEICRVLKEVDYNSDAAYLEAEVDEIARDIEMPMDFHAFVQHMVTPPGETVNKFRCAWDRFCQEVIKADVHGIRHLQRKNHDAGKANPLFRPVYRASQYHANTTTTPTHMSRRASKG